MTEIICKILKNESEILAVAADWRALYAAHARSPFVDYDFFLIWWRNVGSVDGKTLHVAAAWQGQQLIALLPLTVVKRSGLRILEAAGYRAYNYADMLAENFDAALLLWRFVRTSGGYDFADIRDVYPESQTDAALAAFALRRDESRAFALRFSWSSGQAWKDSLPKAQRANFKRCVKRLEEQGAVQFHVLGEGNLPETVTSAMIEQKVAWSKANNMPGLFGHSGVRAYYHQVMEKAAQQNRLFLAWLTCGESIIAYNQGFYHQGLIHMPFWTYDPEWSKYSPGTVILVNTIAHAIDHGLKGLDMRQGESQIKRKHSNEIRNCAEYTFSGSWRGWVAEKSYMGARSLVRKLRAKNDRASPSEKDA